MKHTDQRDRTLTIARILYEETDVDHPIPLVDLNQRLRQRGIPAERKSLYKDLGSLRRHGLGVDFRAGLAGGWYASARAFLPEELSQIIDAVQVYPWLTEETRNQLIRGLVALLPQPQRAGMVRPVTLPRRPWVETEQVRQRVDKIYRALHLGKALTFLTDTESPLTTRRQMISPKSLLWDNGRYHLLAWDHHTGRMGTYELEGLAQLTIAGLPAQGPNVDPAQWLSAPFGLEPEHKVRVRFRCRGEAGEEIKDRFGPVFRTVLEDRAFQFTADVIVGPDFWAWLVGQGGDVEPLGPDWVARLWARRYRPQDMDFLLAEKDKARAAEDTRLEKLKAEKAAALQATEEKKRGKKRKKKT